MKIISSIEELNTIYGAGLSPNLGYQGDEAIDPALS